MCRNVAIAINGCPPILFAPQGKSTGLRAYDGPTMAAWPPPLPVIEGLFPFIENPKAFIEAAEPVVEVPEPVVEVPEPVVEVPEPVVEVPEPVVEVPEVAIEVPKPVIEVDVSAPTAVASRTNKAVAAEAAARYAASGTRSLRRNRTGDTTRVQVTFRDEALCARASKNAHRLFHVATSPTGGQASSSAATSDQPGAVVSDTSRLLARKALQYRNMLQRVQHADVRDPTFDAAAFCGITWRHQLDAQAARPIVVPMPLIHPTPT